MPKTGLTTLRVKVVGNTRFATQCVTAGLKDRTLFSTVTATLFSLPSSISKSFTFSRHKKAMAYDPSAHSFPPSPQQQQAYDPQANLMLQMGLNYGQSLLQQGLQRSEGNFSSYMPFFTNLRCYFRVDNQYVRRKLSIIAFPFLRRFTRPACAPEDSLPSGGSVDNGLDEPGYVMSPVQSPHGSHLSPMKRHVSLPINDPFELDLYLPLMGAITYIILSAFIFGLSFHRVTSEYMVSTLTVVTLWSVAEALALKAAAYALRVVHGVSFVDVLSLCGYKYILICVAVLLRQLFLSDSYAMFAPIVLYVTGSNWVFVTKTLLMLCARNDRRVSPRARLFAYIGGAIHIVSIVFLCLRPHY